ncbi:MAG TPA: amino acid ABC transporter substrate-binding protein [Burkholderiaceae bacterium]|nr:amino acid ABC transporter substrate-binding protein [Burkholderiaceae bacterium]
MGSRRVQAAVAAILCLACVTVHAQTADAPKQPPTLQKVRDTGVITLAHRESSIPFSYLDDGKRPVGYALDLCLRVVEALRRDLRMPNLRVEYLAVTPAQRIPAIVEGKADLECGNTTNTAARRKQAAFTVTHYFAGGRLLVRADSGIERLSGMRDRTIVVNAGSTHAAFLARAQEKGLFNGRVIEAKDADAAFAELEAKRADAYLHDDIVLFALRANSKDPRQWSVVGEFTTVEPLAIMLRRNDPEFKKYVDLVLSRAMIDGEVAALYRKWFNSPIPPKGVTLGIPVSPLLREQFTFPTDKVGDEIGG